MIVAILSPRQSLITLRLVTYWPTWNIDFSVHLRPDCETTRAATAFIIRVVPHLLQRVKSRRFKTRNIYFTNILYTNVKSQICTERKIFFVSNNVKNVHDNIFSIRPLQIINVIIGVDQVIPWISVLLSYKKLRLLYFRLLLFGYSKWTISSVQG